MYLRKGSYHYIGYITKTKIYVKTLHNMRKSINILIFKKIELIVSFFEKKIVLGIPPLW